MQIALDNKRYFHKVLLFVEGTLYFYEKERWLLEPESWVADSQKYTGLRKWYEDSYGLVLSYCQIKQVIKFCVTCKLIRKQSRDKFDAMHVMEKLVEFNNL